MHTRPAVDGTLERMRTRVFVALAAVAATGFGLAAQAQKPASAPVKVVVYKSPT